MVDRQVLQRLLIENEVDERMYPKVEGVEREGEMREIARELL